MQGPGEQVKSQGNSQIQHEGQSSRLQIDLVSAKCMTHKTNKFYVKGHKRDIMTNTFNRQVIFKKEVLKIFFGQLRNFEYGQFSRCYRKLELSFLETIIAL
jgi:hypothetical protein